MDKKSRIKFNPVTKEVEIEGSEHFIRIYFDKIQAMLEGTSAAPSQREPSGGDGKGKRTAQKTQAAAGALKAGSKSSTVLNMIRNSPKGITTGEIEEKTGLNSKQIWAIIYKAKSKGKIKQPRRGVYAAA